MYKKITSYFWTVLIGYLFNTTAIATSLLCAAKLAASANQDGKKAKNCGYTDIISTQDKLNCHIATLINSKHIPNWKLKL